MTGTRPGAGKAEGTMIRFQCGKCGKKLGIADTEAGLTVTCPQCGTKLRIPGERKPGAPAPTPKPKPPPRKPLKSEEAEAETEEIAQVSGDQGFVEVEPTDAPPPRKASRKPRRDEEEDEDEVEERPAKARAKKRRREEDEDEEEEERRPRAKAKRRRDEEEDEEFEDEDDYDDEEKGLVTPNRIRGVAAILGAGGVVAAALLIQKFDDYEYMRYICFGIAGLMVVAGIYYLIKG